MRNAINGGDKELTLIQPMHIHGRAPGDSHVYLPSSLSVVASQAITAGIRTRIVDQNLHELDVPSMHNDVVGMNLVGPPYIPSAIAMREQLASVLGNESSVLMGGQVVSGLNHTQFERLFGNHSVNGNIMPHFADSLGIRLEDITTPEETSMIPAYKTMSDDDIQKYLSTEFCLYLSQGCKYHCDFCAAKRTVIDPATGEALQVVKEQYRNPRIIDEELRYMVERAKKLGIDNFDIYLSNLDLFQTPEKLDEFARTVLEIKKSHPDFMFKLRGLSTVTAFLDCNEKHPGVIERMREAGLYSISYGVDGGTPAVWQSLHKGHNTEDKSLEAIKLTHELGITPEIFMLFGHDADTIESMQTSLDFLQGMSDKYGAKPRPYVAKSIVPGNSGWIDPRNAAFVEMMIAHPEHFKALEYSTLPTSLTHPDPVIRAAVAKFFIKATRITGNTSNIIYPASDPNIDPKLAARYVELNKGRFDR